MLIGDAALAAAIGVASAVAIPVDASLLIVRPELADAALATAVPVIVIDAPDDTGDRVRLLDAGVIDALPRGIAPVELAAKVRALMRLLRATPLVCGDLALDPVDRLVERDGRPIALHPREFAVLLHLARHRDRPVSRPALYGAVWQRRFDPGTNVIAVAVSRLRAKVDGGRRAPLIHTVGGGYMLSDTVAGKPTARQDDA